MVTISQLLRRDQDAFHIVNDRRRSMESLATQILRPDPNAPTLYPKRDRPYPSSVSHLPFPNPLSSWSPYSAPPLCPSSPAPHYSRSAQSVPRPASLALAEAQHRSRLSVGSCLSVSPLMREQGSYRDDHSLVVGRASHVGDSMRLSASLAKLLEWLPGRGGC